MNSVAFAERSKCARHEASHVSAALFLGVSVDEINITPAPESGGYVTGRCTWLGRPSVNIAVTAVGCADGHGVRGPNEEGDAYELERLVPDERERERIMDVARRLMRHPEYLRVRNTLWRRLQHRDYLSRDEIERIAGSVSGLPDATSFRVGESRVEAAASAARRLTWLLDAPESAPAGATRNRGSDPSILDPGGTCAVCGRMLEPR